jgi:hypothetical protein
VLLSTTSFVRRPISLANDISFDFRGDVHDSVLFVLRLSVSQDDAVHLCDTLFVFIHVRGCLPLEEEKLGHGVGDELTLTDRWSFEVTENKTQSDKNSESESIFRRAI